MIEMKDRLIIRNLAEKWMELARLPVMEERKRQWKALKDLKPERPMVLVETLYIEDYVSDAELECKDPVLRTLEKEMRWTIRHAEEVGDDIVIEPYCKLAWSIETSDYGLPIETVHVDGSHGTSLAHTYKNPVTSPADIEKLKPRTRRVNRDKTLSRKRMLEDIMGDIMPIMLPGSSAIHAGITQDLFKLIGMERMMLWLYDEPEAIRQIMQYLRDDRIAQYRWMETEGILGLNNSNCHVGSGSPGYTSDLPANDYAGKTRLRYLWVWMESQETVSISPQGFHEYFLPYMADICKDFGLVYYACCEPVHDRWEYISRAIPNIRTVSISPWCDVFKMGEMLGKDYVLCRKPMPAYISGNTASWDLMYKDVEDTVKATKECNLEFVFRDIVTVNGERDRLSKWVEMARAIINR
jgi:hypothetical protein